MNITENRDAKKAGTISWTYAFRPGLRLQAKVTLAPASMPASAPAGFETEGIHQCIDTTGGAVNPLREATELFTLIVVELTGYT